MNKASNYVAIHSAPRSGSSWLGEIINSSPSVHYSYQPLFSYCFKGRLTESSSSEEIDRFYQQLSCTDDPFLTQQEERASGEKPIFQKEAFTHIVYKEVRYHYILNNLLNKRQHQKAVFLIRNPIEVLLSWKNAKREFRTDLGWEFLQEWQNASSKNVSRREEYFGYKKWKESATLFHSLSRKYPENTILVDYSNLKKKTIQTVEELYSFLGLPITQQTTQFLSNSSSTYKEGDYSVYRQSGSDYPSLPESISQYIQEDLEGSELEKYIQF